MAGIVTNAYFYLQGDHELQFVTTLRTADGLYSFMESHKEGVALYSDYALSDKKTWAAVCRDNALLEAAASGVVVCPITAAILARLSFPLEGLMGLDGQPLDTASTLSSSHAEENANDDRSSALLSAEAQPPRMQADRTLQRILKEIPEAASEMIAKSVLTLDEFQQHWDVLTDETAEKVGITHYRQTARKVLASVSWDSNLSVAQACQEMANAIPPWCDSLAPFLPNLPKRAVNVLGFEKMESPADLSATPPERYLHWRNAGITTLKDLLNSLTAFRDTPITPFSLSDRQQGHHYAVQLDEGEELRVYNELPAITDIQGESLAEIVVSGIEAIKEAAPLAFRQKAIRDKCIRKMDVLIRRAQGATLKEIGSVYGVTRESIRKIEISGFKGIATITLKVIGQITLKLNEMTLTEAPPEDINHLRNLYHRISAFLTLKAGLSAIVRGEADDATTLTAWSKLLIVTHQQLSGVDIKSLLSILETPLWHHETTINIALVYPVNFFTQSLVPRPEMPSTLLLAPLPEEIKGPVESQFITDTLLPMLNGQDVQMINHRVPTQLNSRGWPSVPATLAAECLTLHWMERDGDILNLIDTDNPATRERRRFIELLKESHRPLHDENEIFAAIRPNDRDHPRPKSVVDNWFISIQARHIASGDEDYPVKIGNSMIATMRHMRALGITDQKAAAIATFIEQTLAETPERQFGVDNLCERLEQNGYLEGLYESWPSDWDHPGVRPERFPNMLNVILYHQRPRHARNLGRFQWKYGPWTDDPDTQSRQEIYDFYRTLFLSERRPLTGREMLAALRETRDIIGPNQTQILEAHGLIKLSGRGQDAVYWHEDLGDINDAGVGSSGEHPLPSTDNVRREADDEAANETEHNSGVPAPTPAPTQSTASDHQAPKVVTYIDAILQATNRAMTLREIKERLMEEYGIAPDQIEASDPLVVLQGSGDNAVFWTRSLNKESDADIRALQQDALNWINQRDEFLPVDRLITLFPRHQEMLIRRSQKVWAAWLAQHKAMKIHHSKRGLYIRRDATSQGES